MSAPMDGWMDGLLFFVAIRSGEENKKTGKAAQ
jgi:hypothetical protein